MEVLPGVLARETVGITKAFSGFRSRVCGGSNPLGGANKTVEISMFVEIQRFFILAKYS